MKKQWVLFILLLALAAGCQSPFAETMVLLDEPVVEVNISESAGFGEINDDFLFSFNDKDTVEFFEKAITSAERKAGKADMSAPEYDLVVAYEGGLPSHAIYLWLGNENEASSMMYITDEETVYLTSPKTTKQLRELLLSE